MQPARIGEEVLNNFLFNYTSTLPIVRIKNTGLKLGFLVPKSSAYSLKPNKRYPHPHAETED